MYCIEFWMKEHSEKVSWVFRSSSIESHSFLMIKFIFDNSSVEIKVVAIKNKYPFLPWGNCIEAAQQPNWEQYRLYITPLVNQAEIAN